MQSTSGDTQTGGVTASRWVLAGILLLAAFLRLYKLDLISVTNATAIQEINASAALSFEGWDWPLAGPHTEEVRSSAFLLSAIAVVNMIWRHAFSGIVFVIGLNLCSVALLYRLCAKRFGFHVAVISTLLYAASPWGVLYSRLLLPSSCVAVFSVLLIHLSFRWLDEGGNKLLAMMVLLGCAIPQIHFSGICVPVWLVFVLYHGRKRISIVSVVSGGLLGGLVWAPWIMFQQITGWAELKSWFGQIVESPSAHGHAFLESINYLQSMLHSSKFDYWFGGSPSQWPEYFPTGLRWVWGTAAVLLSGLLLLSAVRIIARKTDLPNRLLLLWVALPVVFGTLLRTGLSPENMLIAFPIPFVLIGVIAARLKESLPPRVRYLPMSAVIGISGLHVVFLACCSQFVNDGHTTMNGRYELSYRQRQATIQSILEDTVRGPVRLVGSFSGWYPAYEYVLLYEQGNQNASLDQQNEFVRYWIDEKKSIGIRDSATWNRKERQINLSISEYLRSPPNWVIERHWSVGEAQIYRLRFVIKKPLQ